MLEFEGCLFAESFDKFSGTLLEFEECFFVESFNKFVGTLLGILEFEECFFVESFSIDLRLGSFSWMQGCKLSWLASE